MTASTAAAISCAAKSRPIPCLSISLNFASASARLPKEARVDAVYARAAKAAADAKAKAQQAADTARKAGAHTALWMFVALLLGAFVASLAATFGGRQRDHERVLRHVTI